MNLLQLTTKTNAYTLVCGAWIIKVILDIMPIKLKCVYKVTNLSMLFEKSFQREERGMETHKWFKIPHNAEIFCRAYNTPSCLDRIDREMRSASLHTLFHFCKEGVLGSWC